MKRKMFQMKPVDSGEYEAYDEVCIRRILVAGGLVPKGGMESAAATDRGPIVTFSHQGKIGALHRWCRKRQSMARAENYLIKSKSCRAAAFQKALS